MLSSTLPSSEPPLSVQSTSHRHPFSIHSPSWCRPLYVPIASDQRPLTPGSRLHRILRMKPAAQIATAADEAARTEQRRVDSAPKAVNLSVSDKSCVVSRVLRGRCRFATLTRARCATDWTSELCHPEPGARPADRQSAGERRVPRRTSRPATGGGRQSERWLRRRPDA